ncbi:hypothetical protein Micbo1qcDRAFT_222266, partial [Microdochium bolleyi]
LVLRLGLRRRCGRRRRRRPWPREAHGASDAVSTSTSTNIGTLLRLRLGRRCRGRRGRRTRPRERHGVLDAIPGGNNSYNNSCPGGGALAVSSGVLRTRARTVRLGVRTRRRVARHTGRRARVWKRHGADAAGSAQDFVVVTLCRRERARRRRRRLDRGPGVAGRHARVDWHSIAATHDAELLCRGKRVLDQAGEHLDLELRTGPGSRRGRRRRRHRLLAIHGNVSSNLLSLCRTLAESLTRGWRGRGSRRRLLGSLARGVVVNHHASRRSGRWSGIGLDDVGGIEDDELTRADQEEDGSLPWALRRRVSGSSDFVAGVDVRVAGGGLLGDLDHESRHDC